MPATILRPYFLTAKNRLLHSNRRNRQWQRDALLVVIALMTMGCIFLGFVMVLQSMGNAPFFRAIVPTKIIELLYYAFFLLLIASNTVAYIGNTYTAENVSLLLTCPVSPLRLYTAKFFETLAETGFMFVIFTLPAGLAYCYSFGLSSKFVFAGFALGLPFLMIPVGIGVILATGFVTFAAHLWRRGLLLIGLLIGLVVLGFVKLITLLSDPRLEHNGTNAIVQVLGFFDNPNPHWLPSRWVADLLSSFVGEPAELPLIKVGLLFSSAIASFCLGFLIFDLFHLTVRSKAGVHSRLANHQGSFSDLPRQLIVRFVGLFPFEQQRQAVVVKDLSSLIRDRAQALQLLMFLGIAAVYIVVFRYTSVALNLAQTATEVWKAFLMTINVLFAGFIMTAVMTRLVYPSVSLEGKAFWIMLIAPIRLKSLIEAKFWCWLPVTSIICMTLFLAGGFAIGVSLPLIGVTTIIAIALSIGCNGLAVGLGSTFATFEWESPNQISVGLGTLMLLLSSLLLVTITSLPAAVVIFLTMVVELRGIVGPTLSVSLIILCLLFILVLNIKVAQRFIRRGTAALIEQAHA